MSTAVKKARRASGVPYVKPQKTPTRPYMSKKELYEQRVTERAAQKGASRFLAGLAASLRNARKVITPR